MSEIKEAKELLESVTYKYENGELSKEDYLELVKDINTSKMVAQTSEELEDLAALNKLLNNIITGVSLVA